MNIVDQSIIHANLFFMISSIGFIIIGIILVVAGVYIVRILKNVQELSEKVKKEGEIILEDVHDLREEILTKGKMATGFLKGMLTVFGVASNLKRSRRSKKAKDDRDEDDE